jgi:hypothetical protein
VKWGAAGLTQGVCIGIHHNGVAVSACRERDSG